LITPDNALYKNKNIAPILQVAFFNPLQSSAGTFPTSYIFRSYPLPE